MPGLSLLTIKIGVYIPQFGFWISRYCITEMLGNG